MDHQRSLIVAATLAAVLLTACGVGADPSTGATTATTAPDPAGTTTAATATTTSVTVANAVPHDITADEEWDPADVVAIVLNGDSITADDHTVAITATTATITSPGTYSITGTLNDGAVVVDSDGDGVVRLLLAGADITNTSGGAIAILDADTAVIVLEDATANRLTDGAGSVFADPTDDEPDAALFSAADLTITGGGSLEIDARYNDGIAGKDGVVIAGSTITVDAIDDGIRGKDYLVVEEAAISVTAGGDGLTSDNEEDVTEGFVAISGGIVEIEAGGDAIQAATDVAISGGQFTLEAGGGATAPLSEADSAKGIKGTVSVVIDGGTFEIDAADDAIHSDGSIAINGGSFRIATGDDGIHADATVDLNGGAISITDSYEGIESAVITINSGDIGIVSADDGLNTAGGGDGSGMQGPGGRPGRDTFAASGDYRLSVNGGTILIDSGGDGIDANGSAEITGGTIVIQGPTENMNGALDVIGTFDISGGLLVAVGSAGMAEAPDASSVQATIAFTVTSTQQAGTIVHIETTDGDPVLTFEARKTFQSVVFSSADVVTGVSYDVYFGGSVSGASLGGLYDPGAYTPGTKAGSLTV